MNIIHPDPDASARNAVYGFTLAALATGAVPVPAASGAVVAQDAVMINVVASRMGVPVSVATVIESVGLVGTANMVGRALFIDAARLLAWGTGPFGLWPVCVAGAFTAGVQTWVLGELTIAICKNGGASLSRAAARQVATSARASFGPVWKEWTRSRRGDVPPS